MCSRMLGFLNSWLIEAQWEMYAPGNVAIICHIATKSINIFQNDQKTMCSRLLVFLNSWLIGTGCVVINIASRYRREVII